MIDAHELSLDKAILEAVIAYDVAHGRLQQKVIDLADLTGGLEVKKKMAYDDINYINGVVPALRRIQGYLDLLTADSGSHQDANKE